MTERTKTSTLEKLVKVAAVLTQQTLELEAWNPGDYKRWRVNSEGGSRHLSPCCRKSELEQWLRAYIAGAEEALGHDAIQSIFSAKGNPWSDVCNQVGVRPSNGEKFTCARTAGHKGEHHA